MVWRIILIFSRMSPTIHCAICTFHLFEKRSASVCYIVVGSYRVLFWSLFSFKNENGIIKLCGKCECMPTIPKILCCQEIPEAEEQVIRVKKLVGAPRTRITWAYSLGSEEASLKLLGLAKLERPNSSPISKSRRSKPAIFLCAI